MKGYMDKRITDAIKGCALICMFVHHFFTFPNWYIEGVSYPELTEFAALFREPLKICVPVFAFLTGYFYFFNTKKSMRYSVQKISDVLVSYWMVYIPLLIFAVSTKCYRVNAADIFYEMLALKRPIMSFCWYVYFYYCTMLLLPLLSRNTKAIPFAADIVVWLLLPNIACIVFIHWNNNDLIQQIPQNMKLWFPCVAAGYLFAKHKLFDLFDSFLGNTKPYWNILLYVLLIIGSAMGRYVCDSFTIGSILVRDIPYNLTFSMDIVYSPIFIYGLAKLLQCVKISWILKLLGELGKKSLVMWFVHCCFFSCCSPLTQKILYFPKNPILVTIFGLLLCYVAAVLFSYVIDPVLKRKNAFLRGGKKTAE